MAGSTQKGRMPPIPGDVPHSRLCLGSEITEASIETSEGVLIGIRHRSKPVEAFGVRLRYRSKTGEASERRHRHHSKAACKRRRHRTVVGVLHTVSVEGGVGGYDFDRYFRFVHNGLGLGLCFTSRLALDASFCGREFRSVFICFSRQDCRTDCAGLSSEDLHKAKKANGHHG